MADSSMGYSTLLLAVKDSIANITLNRPDCANAINATMWDELTHALNWVDQNVGIHVIIISGSGRNFCSGIDLGGLASFITSSESCEGRKRENLRAKILKLQESFNAIEKCRKPVIAAIHGACVGGGLDLVSACDIRICNQEAMFSLKEIDLSIVADMGVLQRLSFIVGQGILRELAYTGRKVLASEALQLGLVNHVYASYEDLMEEAFKLAAVIASKSPLTIRGIKQIINYSRNHSVADGLDYVATWNAGMILSDDLQESILAYQQKRQAQFKS